MTNAGHIRGSAWLQFRRVLCGNWRHGNVILLGDAAHTAHFSIGSGTKLALEDAIELAKVLSDPALDFETALARYYDTRQLEALKLQSAARNSTEWFEQVERYLSFEPMQFAYSLLTRSQRVSHENLRLRDPAWLEGVETWFSGRSHRADVRAVQAARYGACQPHRRLADGDVFARSTACRPTSILCITARARLAVRGSSIPR